VVLSNCVRFGFLLLSVIIPFLKLFLQTKYKRCLAVHLQLASKPVWLTLSANGLVEILQHRKQVILRSRRVDGTRALSIAT